MNGAPAWTDDNDQETDINLNSLDRLKKLKTKESDNKISGVEFSNLLRERYYYPSHTLL